MRRAPSALLWLWLLQVGLAASLSFDRRSVAHQENLRFLDYVYSMQSDLLLFLFAMLPVWILFIGWSRPTPRSEYELIRHGSYQRHLRHRTYWYVGHATVFSLLALLGHGLGAMGLPLGDNWSETQLPHSALLGLSPLGAIPVQVLVPLAPLALIGTAIYLVSLMIRPGPALSGTLLVGTFVILVIAGQAGSDPGVMGIFLVVEYSSWGQLVSTQGLIILALAALLGIGGLIDQDS